MNLSSVFEFMAKIRNGSSEMATFQHRDGTIAENNERKAFAHSGFIQHRFTWKNLALTPGVRFERVFFSRTNRLANNGAGATGETTVTEIIPGFGIAYSGVKNTTLYAGVHRGFSPPRVEDVVTNSGGVIELDSELSWNYEVGVRTRPLRGTEFSAAFFRNDYQNQIVAASIAGGAAFTNGGATLQQGFEFTGQIDSGSLFRSPIIFTCAPPIPFCRRRSSVACAKLYHQFGNT
ncbi:MAG: TonB-dependent receptor [Acidobacteria bacterium]|nr:TonB-dependent receptor [Acidobacteriota bacterium]